MVEEMRALDKSGEPAATLEKERREASPRMGALPVSTMQTKWSAVIINYNGADLITDTIRSIVETLVPPDEIIVVDDGSSDASINCVRARFPYVRIIELRQNTGRTSIVRNAGLAAAKHRYVRHR